MRKDPQLASCLIERTTSTPESFQKNVLMYTEKRFTSSYGVYKARTFLAAWDHKHHNHHLVHVNSSALLGLPIRSSIHPDDPRTLGPLSRIIPPPTAELVPTQQHRGQDLMCDPLAKAAYNLS